jgi:hypothetical protein
VWLCEVIASAVLPVRDRFSRGKTRCSIQNAQVVDRPHKEVAPTQFIHLVRWWKVIYRVGTRKYGRIGEKYGPEKGAAF